MTIIEFFDDNSIDNIVSALLCAPDKVIFIGDNGRKMQRSIERYKSVTDGRGLKIEYSYKKVGRNNLGNIVELLSGIVEQENDCIFDLDGGEDLFLVAIGMVAQKYSGKVKMHRFNVRNGVLADCDADGNTCLASKAEISIEENVKIYGGKIVYADEKENATYRWSFDDEFICDIENMWAICRVDAGLWNAQIGSLAQINKLFCRKDSLEVEGNYEIAKRVLIESGVNFVFTSGLLKRLERVGLIRRLDFDSDSFSFAFKNESVKRCLTKAGQILELYIAAEAMKLKNPDDTPVYNDVMTGVFIDWDGNIGDSNEIDVENEVDVILMKGLIPVFISCKNGVVEIDELYKLSTVAERFGGKYAKKVLIASELDKLGVKADYIRARAADMGIRVLENVDEMSETALCKSLKSLWSN